MCAIENKKAFTFIRFAQMSFFILILMNVAFNADLNHFFEARPYKGGLTSLILNRG
jgi:hypothetical protein